MGKINTFDDYLANIRVKDIFSSNLYTKISSTNKLFTDVEKIKDINYKHNNIDDIFKKIDGENWIKYKNLIPVLVSAIINLNKRVKDLENFN